MVSSEKRDTKPYAVPVRVLPFHSLSDQKVMDLRDELKDALIARGLIVVGFVTDGEWNSMRTQGSHRPVSVIQLMMDAKKKANKVHINEIRQFLTLSSSTKKPVKEHPAIPLEDIVFLNELCMDGKGIDKAIFFSEEQNFFPSIMIHTLGLLIKE